MFTHNDEHNCDHGLITITDLPAVYRRQVIRYLCGTAEVLITEIDSWVSCDACGRRCKHVQDNIHICSRCVELYTMGEILTQPAVCPQIHTHDILRSNAQYAFGMMLSASFQRIDLSGSRNCDICIHATSCVGINFVRARAWSSRHELVMNICVCKECYNISQTRSGELLALMRLLIRFDEHLVPDVSRALRELVFATP